MDRIPSTNANIYAFPGHTGDQMGQKYTEKCQVCGGPPRFPPHPLAGFVCGPKTFLVCDLCETQLEKLYLRVVNGLRRMHGLETLSESPHPKPGARR